MKPLIGKDAASAPLPLAVRIGGVVAASALTCVLALVVVFGNGNVSYRYGVTDQLLLNDATLFALLALALIGIWAYLRRRERTSCAPERGACDLHDRFFRNRCALICGTVFLAEALITAAGGFVPGWDVTSVLDAPVHGIPLDLVPYRTVTGAEIPYFAMFPNNIFLVSFLSVLCGSTSSSFIASMVACLCVSASIFLISRVVLSLTCSKRWAVASLALSVLLIGLLPWFFVPYSDVFGLFCVTSALWALTCLSKPFLRWSAFFALSAVGYFLKPTAVFLPAAVLLVSAVAALGRRPFPLRPALRAAGGALAGCGVAALVFAVLVLPIGFSPDPNRAFGPAHYLMMGLNEESGGGFSHLDVQFSIDQPSKEARDRADLEVAFQRISDMGFVGTAELFAKKTLSNYNDGTFAWGQDKPFFPPEFEGRVSDEDYANLQKSYEAQMSSPFSRALASYYWNSGRYYEVFQTVQQAVWLATLLGVALCLVGFAAPLWRRLDARSTATVVAILVSLVMLTVFLMVFECRARYLYLYAGLYIVAAIWGYRCLFELARGRRRDGQVAGNRRGDGAASRPPL